MMKRETTIMFACLIALPAVCQFQAEMISAEAGVERHYKVYSDATRYRYEFEEAGMNGVVIVFPGENKTYILLPEGKMVHQTTCDAIISKMNDPVQSYQWLKGNGTEKHVGSEMLQGMSCRKSEIYMQEQKIFTVWYSDKLNFPLKIINNTAENTSVQLTKITDWTVDPAFFTVPSDYTEVDEKMRPVVPEPPPPDKWTVVDGSIPYEGRVSRGTKVRLPVESSVYHKVQLSNNGEGMAKVVSHLFRDGAELPDGEQGPLKYRTKRLQPGENSTKTHAWKPGDLVILEVHEGTMLVKVYLEK
jgi:hypothetical protein